MPNTDLIKTCLSSGTIAPYRIVAHGSADHEVAQAASATGTLMGTAMELGTESNGRVDVAISALPLVEYGGDVLRGDPLTSDANGKAIKATVSGSRLIGFAWVSASAGDIAEYQHSLGILP